MKTLTLDQSKACHPLSPAVLDQLGGDEDAIQSAIDAASHGASCGFSGFVYYDECERFTLANLEAIAESVENMADDIDESPINLVKGFGCLRDDRPSDKAVALALWANDRNVDKDIVEEVTAVRNALAWFALEEVGNALIQLAESD